MSSPRSHGRIIACAVGGLVAAALLAQSARSQSPPGSGAVSAWLTTVDQANLLTPQPLLSFAPDSVSTQLTIDVDESTTYQEMDGFGASFTESSAWLVHDKLPAADRDELMVKLFDRTAGIGLSYLRQPIGASDFAFTQYTYDDMPAGQTDPTLAHFSIDHDRASILPMLQHALRVNPQIRIIATPWSPPAWMKTSRSMFGGRLEPSAEEAYANYLVKFVQGYQAAGVPIHRMTPQNEPHYTPSDYPGMFMEYTQQAEFIGSHLGPALAAAGLQTRIITWDHNWNDTTYAPYVFADPTASPFVSGAAWHCYAGTPGAMTVVHDQYPAKDVLITECSGGTDPPPFSDAFAEDMHMFVIGGTRNWARVLVKWNVALDPNYGPHTGGCTTCTGLVTIDPAIGAVTAFNYDYYSLGHISKFVVPGARRIASNTFGAYSIEDVAFRNPDGSIVLVAFNADSVSKHTFKVRQGGQSFTYTLPPRGAVTFTWNGSGATESNPNLALGRPATASSQESASYSAADAVDGSTSTRWSSAFSDPQWIYVDLGSRFTLSRVVINWESAFAAAYQLQVSDDAASWATFYSTSAGRGGTETITPGTPPTGRYLRVLCTTRTFVYGQQWGYSIWELQAYGTPAGTTLPPPPTVTPTVTVTSPANGATFTAPASIAVTAGASSTAGISKVDFYANSSPIGTDTSSPYSVAWNNVPAGTYSITARATGSDGGVATSSPVAITVTDSNSNLALGRPAVASSQESSSYPAAYAVDGKTSTRWSSAFSDPQWIYVDLGSRSTLSRVVINWESAFAAAYQLQVSDDAASWATFYSTSAGQGGTETITPGAPPTGRYLRLYCTTRTIVYGQQWGYSVWELQAYGTPAGTTSPPPATSTPTVALTSPVNGATFTAPASITVSADAASPAGISKVDFYANGALAGTDSSSPYSVTWNNVAAGSYSITATATGADGGVATSSPVSVTVADSNSNLALGRTAVASSTESSSYRASNAVDGSTSTRWSSAFSDPQWIYVDLGSRFTLSRVVINWELAFAAAYQLQVSDDGTNWTTFYSTTAGRGGTETITPGASPTGRYVRLLCTARTFVYGQQWGYSIWELQAFGTPAG